MVIAWVNDGGTQGRTGPLTFTLNTTANNKIVVGATSDTAGVLSITDTVGTVYARKRIYPIGARLLPVAPQVPGVPVPGPPAQASRRVSSPSARYRPIAPLGHVELWTGVAASSNAANSVKVTFSKKQGDAPRLIATVFQYSGVVGEGKTFIFSQNNVPTTQGSVGLNPVTVQNVNNWIVAVEGYSNVGGNGAASAGGAFPGFVTGGILTNDVSGEDGRVPFGATSGLAFISGLCDSGTPGVSTFNATIDPDVPGVGTEATTSIYLELKAV